MVIYQLNINYQLASIRQNFYIYASLTLFHFEIVRCYRVGIANYLMERYTKPAASGYNFPLGVKFFNYVVDTLWYKRYSMFNTFLPSHIIYGSIIPPILTLYLPTQLTKLRSHWKLQTRVHSKDWSLKIHPTTMWRVL